MVRSLGGEADAGAAETAGGVIVRWGGLAASSEIPANALEAVDRLGRFGVGRSAGHLTLAICLSSQQALTSSSLVNTVKSDIFMLLRHPN